MKIEEIACYSVDIPAKGGTYVMSHGRALHSFPSTVVKVTAADGTTGFGEACTLGGNYLDGFPGSARETIRELAGWVLECDPLESDVLVDGMDELLQGHLPGKAAIDIAMWDLRGRLLGLPVARLLGGVRQAEMDVFQAISLASPTEMVEEVAQVAARGVRAWQLKLGDNPMLDAARVRAVAAAIPSDSTFMTSDANRGYTVADTLRFLRGVGQVDTYLEQPCPTTAELARVRPHSPLPIMIDESARTPADVLDALALGCIDAINLKPVRVGGLTKAARIRDMAQAAGVKIMVDEPQGADLATAGMVQLAATIDPRHLLAVSCFLGDHMPLSYRHAGDDSGPRYTGGSVVWNDAPGLGVKVDESVLGEPVFALSRAR
jgi:L-alanine-DL-glutamate epimerase-like enolase superfamily enzyme